MKLRIVPYRPKSKSAKDLAIALTGKLGYKVWRGPAKYGHRNLLWGKPGHPATNKIATFEILEKGSVNHVPYTTSSEVAQGWQKEGYTVFARTAGGQGGNNITVVLPDETLPERELYTQYVKKKKEFRVHVFNGKVIDVQEKRKKSGKEVNQLIRSHSNGWVFCHQNIEEPPELRSLGIAAVQALGLDFGAVDIIWNQHYNKCYVLEVNTAPGLCPTTTELYANEIASQL